MFNSKVLGVKCLQLGKRNLFARNFNVVTVLILLLNVRKKSRKY